MTDCKRKTKRKVDLVSSHSDNEHENGPLAAHSLEGSAVSDIYKYDGIPAFLRYLPREGETLISEGIYIPDVDYFLRLIVNGFIPHWKDEEKCSDAKVEFKDKHGKKIYKAWRVTRR
jgi:hypothetical protein